MQIGKVRCDKIILFLLLLIITQFNNMQVYWSVAFILMILFVQIYPSGKMYRLPVTQWVVLILTFVTYFAFYKQNHEVEIFRYMTYLIGPPLFYYCGMVYTRRYKGDHIEEVFENVMLILSLGGTLYATACCVYKYMNYGQYLSLMVSESIVKSMQSRYALDIWSGALFQPTNLNSYCIFSVISLFPATRFVENKVKKILFYCSAILAVIVCLVSASRTNLLFLILAFLLGVLATGDFGKKRGIFSLTKSKVLGALVLVLSLLIFSDQIATLIQNSSLGARLGSQNLTVSTDGRWERMGIVLEHILDYPFGNMPYGEAHNLWLDTARVSGIAPMILMMIFTVSAVFNALKYYRRKNCSLELRIWMLLAVFILFLSFMIEPVLEGRPYIFIIFCFLAGANQAVLKYSVGLCDYSMGEEG